VQAQPHRLHNPAGALTNCFQSSNLISNQKKSPSHFNRHTQCLPIVPVSSLLAQGHPPAVLCHRYQNRKTSIPTSPTSYHSFESTLRYTLCLPFGHQFLSSAHTTALSLATIISPQLHFWAPHKLSALHVASPTRTSKPSHSPEDTSNGSLMLTCIPPQTPFPLVWSLSKPGIPLAPD